MKALVALLVLAVPAIVSAGGYTYDWRSGNSYNYYTGPSGNTTVNGFNSRTGSSWNTTIQPNGNMRGFDSGGNSWNYNDSTGYYWNSNGTTCFGKGAFRTCN